MGRVVSAIVGSERGHGEGRGSQGVFAGVLAQVDVRGEGALAQHGPEISQSGRSVPMIQRGAE